MWAQVAGPSASGVLTPPQRKTDLNTITAHAFPSILTSRLLLRLRAAVLEDKRSTQSQGIEVVELRGPGPRTTSP